MTYDVMVATVPLPEAMAIAVAVHVKPLGVDCAIAALTLDPCEMAAPPPRTFVPPGQVAVETAETVPTPGLVEKETTLPVTTCVL
ncbi:MAG: hypothetical protein QOF82_2351, partial [Frankiales bacterium]|nr:hypothetical protein [Frankiales bacterium]